MQIVTVTVELEDEGVKDLPVSVLDLQRGGSHLRVRPPSEEAVEPARAHRSQDQHRGDGQAEPRRLKRNTTYRRTKPGHGARLRELDLIGARVFARAGTRSGPQLDYGFPGSNCIRLDDGALHGIAEETRHARV
jgi:hypothetical protein